MASNSGTKRDRISQEGSPDAKRCQVKTIDQQQCEAIAQLERGCAHLLKALHHVCELVGQHSDKDADVVHRAGVLVAQHCEEGALAIDELATACKDAPVVGDQLDDAFGHQAVFPDEIMSPLPTVGIVDVFRDAMSRLVYTGQWMLAAGKCALFSPSVASTITTPAPMHLT